MRILIADDHDLVRETVAAFLRAQEGAIVSLAASLDEAKERVKAEGPFDLILLDYDMPGMLGLYGLDQMIEANDGHPVALMSGIAARDVAERALAAGAAGFVPKTLSSRAMASAARMMIAGETYAPVDFMAARDESAGIALSRREAEVLRGLCEGKSNKEIARDLDLQEVTIKLHVKTLSRKLGAKNRTHAAMIGRDRALI